MAPATVARPTWSLSSKSSPPRSLLAGPALVLPLLRPVEQMSAGRREAATQARAAPDTPPEPAPVMAILGAVLATVVITIAIAFVGAAAATP